MCVHYKQYVSVCLDPYGKRGEEMAEGKPHQVKRGMCLVVGLHWPMCMGKHRGELLLPD